MAPESGTVEVTIKNDRRSQDPIIIVTLDQAEVTKKDTFGENFSISIPGGRGGSGYRVTENDFETSEKDVDGIKETLRNIEENLKSSIQGTDSSFGKKAEALHITDMALAKVSENYDTVISSVGDSPDKTQKIQKILKMKKAVEETRENIRRSRDEAESKLLVYAADTAGSIVRQVPVVGDFIVDNSQTFLGLVQLDGAVRNLQDTNVNARQQKFEENVIDADVLGEFAAYGSWRTIKNGGKQLTGPLSSTTFRMVANMGGKVLSEEQFKLNEDLKNAFGVGAKMKDDDGSTKEFDVKMAYSAYQRVHEAAVTDYNKEVNSFISQATGALQAPFAEGLEQAKTRYEGEFGTAANNTKFKALYEMTTIPTFQELSNDERYKKQRDLFINTDGTNQDSVLSEAEYQNFLKYAGGGNPLRPNLDYKGIKDTAYGAADELTDLIMGRFDDIGKRRERPGFNEFKGDMQGLYPQLTNSKMNNLWKEVTTLKAGDLENANAYQSTELYKNGIPLSTARMYSTFTNDWQGKQYRYGSDAKTFVAQHRNDDGFNAFMEGLRNLSGQKQGEQPWTEAELNEWNSKAGNKVEPFEKPSFPVELFGLSSETQPPLTYRKRTSFTDQELKDTFGYAGRQELPEDLQTRNDDPRNSEIAEKVRFLRENLAPDSRNSDVLTRFARLSQDSKDVINRLNSDDVDLLFGYSDYVKNARYARPSDDGIMVDPPQRDGTIKRPAKIPTGSNNDYAVARKLLDAIFTDDNNIEEIKKDWNDEELEAYNDLLSRKFDNNADKFIEYKNKQQEYDNYVEERARKQTEEELGNQSPSFLYIQEDPDFEGKLNYYKEPDNRIDNDQDYIDFMARLGANGANERDAVLNSFIDRQERYDEELKVRTKVNGRKINEKLLKDISKDDKRFFKELEEFNGAQNQEKRAEYRRNLEKWQKNEKENNVLDELRPILQDAVEDEKNRKKGLRDTFNESEDAARQEALDRALAKENRKKSERDDKINEWNNWDATIKRWEAEYNANPLFYEKNREELEKMLSENAAWLSTNGGRLSPDQKKAEIIAKIRGKYPNMDPGEAQKIAEEFVDGLDYKQEYEYKPGVNEPDIAGFLKTGDIKKLGDASREAVTLGLAAAGINVNDLYDSTGKVLDKKKVYDTLKKQAILRAAFPAFSANRNYVNVAMTALGSYLGIDKNEIASWTANSTLIADVMTVSTLALPYLLKGYQALLWGKKYMIDVMEPKAVGDGKLIIRPLRKLTPDEERGWSREAWSDSLKTVTRAMRENAWKTNEAARGILDANSSPGDSDAERRDYKILTRGQDPLQVPIKDIMQYDSEKFEEWVHSLRRIPWTRVRRVVNPKRWQEAINGSETLRAERQKLFLIIRQLWEEKFEYTHESNILYALLYCVQGFTGQKYREEFLKWNATGRVKYLPEHYILLE